MHRNDAHIGGMSTLTPSETLQDGRDVIRTLTARHRTANPRILGSVLAGRDGANSDLDLLVETKPETTLFDLGGLQNPLEEALHVPSQRYDTAGSATPHPRPRSRSGGARMSQADRLADHLRQMLEGSKDAISFTEGIDREDFLADLRT